MMILIFTFGGKKSLFFSFFTSFTCKQDRVNWLKFGSSFYRILRLESHLLEVKCSAQYSRHFLTALPHSNA